MPGRARGKLGAFIGVFLFPVLQTTPGLCGTLLISVPYPVELNDLGIFTIQGTTGTQFAQIPPWRIRRQIAAP